MLYLSLYVCVFPVCHVFNLFFLGTFWLCSSIALVHYQPFQICILKIRTMPCVVISFFPRSNWPLTFVEKKGKKQDKIMDHRSKDEKGEE